MFKKYSQMKLQIWSVAKFGTVKVSRISPVLRKGAAESETWNQ